MANEIRISSAKSYLELDSSTVFVSAVKTYIEIISAEIRVSALQAYVELSGEALFVSAANTYVEIKSISDKLVLYLNGVLISGIKSFSYSISIKTADVTTLNDIAQKSLPLYSNKSVVLEVSWYKELLSAISVGSSLNNLDVLITDRYNNDTFITLRNAFATKFTVENSLDSEIISNITLVGD